MPTPTIGPSATSQERKAPVGEAASAPADASVRALSLTTPGESRPAREHGPDVGHDPVLDHVEDVVQVDGGRAVPGHDLDPVAEVDRRRAGEVEERVLLRVVADLTFRVRDHRRQHEVDPDRLAAGVEHDRVALPADDGSEHGQSDLEPAGNEVAVEAVHQRVRARLHLVDARVRAGDEVGAGAARRDDLGGEAVLGEMVDGLDQSRRWPPPPPGCGRRGRARACSGPRSPASRGGRGPGSRSPARRAGAPPPSSVPRTGPCPTSSSISTASREPASTAARSRASTFRASSTATVIRCRAASAASAATLSGWTTWFATRTSSIPASAITCASQTVAQATPIAPASHWSTASSGDLCTLMCGRNSAGSSRNRSAMIAMFRFATSRSSRSAGVVTSSRARPIWSA